MSAKPIATSPRPRRVPLLFAALLGLTTVGLGGLAACTEVDPRNPFDDETPADKAAYGQVWVRMALVGESSEPVSVRRAALCGVSLTLTGPDRGGERLSVVGRLGADDCPGAPPPPEDCPAARFEGEFAVIPLCGLHPTSAAGGYTLSASAPGFLPVAPMAVPAVLSGRRVYLDLTLSRCSGRVSGEVATRDTRPTWVQVWPALRGAEECAGAADTAVARVRGGTFQLSGVTQPPAGLLCVRAEADGHLPRSEALPVDLCRGDVNLGCLGLPESAPGLAVKPVPAAGGTDIDPPYTNSRLVQVEVELDAALALHLSRPTCAGAAPHPAVTECAGALGALPADACGATIAATESCRDTEVWLRMEETRGTNLASFVPWSRLSGADGSEAAAYLGSIPPGQCDAAIAAAPALSTGPVCEDGKLKLRSYFCLTAPEQGVHGLRARLVTGRLPDRPQGQVNADDDRPDVASPEARVLLDEEAPPRSDLELGCAQGAVDDAGVACVAAPMRGVHYFSARAMKVVLFAGEEATPDPALRWAIAQHPEARECPAQVPAIGDGWAVSEGPANQLRNTLSGTLADLPAERQTLCVYGFDQARRPWVERRSLVWLPAQPALEVAPAGCDVRTAETEVSPGDPAPVGCAEGDARWGVNNCQAMPTACQTLLATAPINPPEGANDDRNAWTARYVALRVSVEPVGHPVAALRVENQALVSEGFLPDDGLLVPWDLGPPRQWSRPLTVVLTDPLGREQRQTVDFTVSAPAPLVGGVRTLFCPPNCSNIVLADRFGVPVTDLTNRPECSHLCDECVPTAFEIPGTGIPLLSGKRSVAVQLLPSQPPIGPVCTAWWPVEAGRDAGVGPDAAVDAGPDAEVDAGVDAGPEAGLDAGPEAGLDAGPEAGLDAEVAVQVDAEPPGPNTMEPTKGEGQLECPGYVVTLHDLATRSGGATVRQGLKRVTVPFARYDLVCQSGDRLEGQQTLTVMVDYEAPQAADQKLTCAVTRIVDPPGDAGPPRCVPGDPAVQPCEAGGTRRFVRQIKTTVSDGGNDELEKAIRTRLVAVPEGTPVPDPMAIPLCGSLNEATPSSRRLPNCVDNVAGANTDCQCMPYGPTLGAFHNFARMCVWTPLDPAAPGFPQSQCRPALDPESVDTAAFCTTNGHPSKVFLLVEDAAGNRELRPLGNGALLPILY